MEAATGDRGMSLDPPTLDPAVSAAVFAAAPTPMLLVDLAEAERAVVAANHAFQALTGHGAAEAIAGGLDLVHPPELAPDGLQRLDEALKAGGGRVALLARRRNETAVPVTVAVAPIGLPDGPPTHAVLAYHDASEEQALKQALDAAQVELARSLDERASDLRVALDEKTALLHEVDHRVKNNLQVISSLILLKARRTAASATRGALNSMAERIGALSTVHKLLYAVGDKSRLDLKEFMTDFGADLAATTDPSRVSLTLDVEPIAIAGSKAAPLALLVHELATNAVRHAFPEGASGHVAISARREGNAIRLVVADDGVGLAAGAPNPEAFGRTLVDMVVRQMRGAIVWEETAPGTRALVTIPLDPQEVEAA